MGFGNLNMTEGLRSHEPLLSLLSSVHKIVTLKVSFLAVTTKTGNFRKTVKIKPIKEISFVRLTLKDFWPPILTVKGGLTAPITLARYRQCPDFWRRTDEVIHRS